MAAVTTTTISAALAAGDKKVYLTSATGVSAGTLLYIDHELMRCTAISGTIATVERGLDGTHIVGHLSGAAVYLANPSARVFRFRNQVGTATAASDGPTLPVIVPSTGKFFDIEGGQWVEVDRDLPTTVLTEGTPATGVTVTEYGEGRNHLTKLTFSALTVDAVAAGAAEAIGKLAYTFPAGVIKVKSAYMSIGLTNTDGNIDADTPDMGLGTVIATGAVATLDGTATFEDILTGQTVNDCTGTAEVKTVHSELVIETGAAHTVHLNVADTWAGAETALVAAGTITLEWVLLPT